jgi:NAD(P)-dependent dehydrogenase (short-subunit alcohol dehydrogenase family)
MTELRSMKTVIITGAGGNLGTAVVKTFLDKNYRVIATVHKEAERQELPESENLQVQAVNLTSEAETEAFVRNATGQHPKIDAALLLVGGFAIGNIAKTGSEDIRKQISLNFDTAYHVVRPLFQHMLEQNNGKIIFIGARPALQASAGKNLIAYGLSKSLLFKLADYLNAEAKGKNVTASVVSLSTLDTPVNRKSMPDADPDKWVKPEALAGVLEFVVSGTGDPLRETVLKVYNNS